MEESTTLVRRLPRSPRELLVWTYVIALSVVAAVAWALVTHNAVPHGEPHLPWWAVALGFAAAELCVVHVRFRRSAHSFSLADLPFVFGLVFATGDDFVMGALVGHLVVLGLIRRLEIVKLLFNLAQLALAATLAAAILNAIAGGADAMQPETWIGLYAATLASGALTIVLLGVAMAFAEGRPSTSMLAQMFATDALVTLINASIAIAAALVVATDPRAVPVLLIPALTVFAVYRAYISERQRHERLEFLYDANRTLSRSPEVAEALEALLARSLEAFNADVAEVLLHTSDGDPLRTTHGPGDLRTSMEPADKAIAEELAGFVDADRPAISLTPPFGSPHLRAHLQSRGIRHAMIAMLPGEERTIGTIMLANRVGLERSFGADDLRLLEALANNAAVALQYDRLEQAVNKLESLQEQLHHQAYHDPLTDLPNRTLFMERVREELADDGAAAVLFVDVDDFKTINDSLGHHVGDALLVSVAKRMRECVRPEDTIARLGGDEFAVMIPGVGDPLVDGRAVARRILKAFELPVEAGTELVSVHLSVGLASSHQSGGDGDELIRNADVAMYQAKSKGKARFELFEPQMAAAILRRHDLKEELAKAIEREQMIVQYQPIVALDSGRIVAAEALVRWEHPSRGLVPPGDFVPLAEETGLIVPLGRYVLREACRQARRWQDAETEPGVEPLRMHVNLSVAELRDPDLVKNVLACIRESGIDPQQLVIEITESQLLAAASVERFHELRALGVKIALDDFGTGYSSLSYLHSLPLDTLKIAKPFIDGLTSGRRESSFVGMIVDLAKTLELEVIAEGIETSAQLAALREMNAGLGQGYFLGRPSAAAPRLAA
ncbi:EAL domain-containing protein [Solirubrobacter sp. CPCC 204708]|uniref:EAL domain-containing protein n=1 Tax=Solirubrobacter deserti TaxID=2282478 RepID=A0ABT4RNC8_9ACTN|nr:EAL domain-containing protein [Solirubrobacter deserti]MBE2315018.1 EAL domain-containing protein [Solirubrobacter deserti]MDA0139933.1 EAL domain-containing protein [Solirubrobacter deserti]